MPGGAFPPMRPRPEGQFPSEQVAELSSRKPH
jgi:hypothetical protein